MIRLILLWLGRLLPNPATPAPEPVDDEDDDYLLGEYPPLPPQSSRPGSTPRSG